MEELVHLSQVQVRPGDYGGLLEGNASPLVITGGHRQHLGDKSWTCTSHSTQSEC